jgi:uncharacterized membrane protein SpoIIM required for sporulation
MVGAVVGALLPPPVPAVTGRQYSRARLIRESQAPPSTGAFFRHNFPIAVTLASGVACGGFTSAAGVTVVGFSGGASARLAFARGMPLPTFLAASLLHAPLEMLAFLIATAAGLRGGTLLLTTCRTRTLSGGALAAEGRGFAQESAFAAVTLFGAAMLEAHMTPWLIRLTA